jgi:Holliday junction resolvase RusA-like endonuclease
MKVSKASLKNIDEKKESSTKSSQNTESKNSDYSKSYYVISLPGKPIAKMRPRFRTRGAYVQTYDKQSKEKAKTRLEIISQWPHEPIAGPVGLFLTFYTPIPTSWSKKRQREAVWDTTRPDVDNYDKFYLDLMNEIVFKDDNQVVQIFSQKVYSTDPKTEILIRQVQDVEQPLTGPSLAALLDQTRAP